MESTKRYYPILLLSIPLLTSLSFVSWVGLFIPDFYLQETFHWQVKTKGQDIIDLFVIVPVLLISALSAYRGNKMSLLIWAGTNLYLVYTFIIFSFDIHFNSLFLLYCLSLGLSFYSILYFIYLIVRQKTVITVKSNGPVKFTSLFFMVISLLFAGLWLTQIVTWIQGETIPQALREVGLPTNPIHVIDLSVILPGVFIIGLLLWKKSSFGILMAPIVLVFFVLMNITIAVLNYMMYQIIPSTGMVITGIMCVLTILSALLLYGFWPVKEIIIIPLHKFELKQS